MKVGLALGGGGIKGLGHLGLLKLLDELEIVPSHIAGTSMGAIIGSLYSLGLNGKDIEARVREHIVLPGAKIKDIYKNRKQLLKWAKVFTFEKTRGGVVAAHGLFEHLFSELIDKDFNDCKIPFSASSTDFHLGEEYILNSGKLLPAVLASMAVPGIFSPVKHNDRLLVDGGLVNNVPTSHLNDCDFIIASNVISLPTGQDPKALDVINGGINIMIRHNTLLQLQKFTPDVLFDVDSSGIDAFDFIKIDSMLKRGDQTAAEYKSTLTTLFESYNLHISA